jgi:hypothetical protein
MAGAAPYLNARPQDARLLPAAAQAQPHGRVSPIVRSAQQALPADPSEHGVAQTPPSPRRGGGRQRRAPRTQTIRLATPFSPQHSLATIAAPE